MKDSKRNVPRLRFPEFTDDWEQRKLGDLTDFVTGKSFTADLSSDGTYVVMDMGTVSQEGNRIETKTTDVKRDVLNKNDLIMPKDDIGGGLIIGRTAYIPVDNHYVLGDHVYRLRFTNENGLFLHYQINSDSVRKQIMPLVTGSAQLGLNSKSIQGVYVSVPSSDEQAQIGELFANLDNTITLHQRKLDSIKEYKNGMLQKMFPKDGQKFPEIRFPEFTGDWEQRKLSDIYKDIGNAFVGTATPYYVEDGHFYLESNNIKDGQINHNTEVFINDEFYEKQKDKWLHTGDMVMVQSGHVGHAAVIPEELDCSAAHALIMFRNPKVEIEPYFLNYQYQTLKAKKKIENITTGNTIKHILASEMQEFVVDVASYDEQEKIAGFFRDLDNLITLHQRKLDAMKEYKKGLLQQMFV